MDFIYKAKDKNGNLTSGEIKAETEKQALSLLSKQNIFVLEITGENSVPKLKKFTFKKKITLKDKIVFTKQLAMMVKGGLPLVEALNALEEQTENKNFSKAIKEIAEDVRGGTALSKALGKQPKIFSKLYVSVTASGERTGKLDEVLERLSDQLQKDYDLITKIKTAITYPIVIVCALIGIVILMIVFVIPQLKTIFSEMGVALPLPTRILLGLSDSIIDYWYLFILLIVGAFFGIRFWARKPSGGQVLDNIKIKVPIFGVLVRKIYMARFSRTTATLIASGLPMLEVIATVKEVVGNKIYMKSFDKISSDVESGITLSTALRKHTQLFPVMISQMVAVGEKSGKVDEILNHLANFYDKEVEASTASLASMIEPILILLIGAGIGAAIAAVILPIYSLVNVL